MLSARAIFSSDGERSKIAGMDMETPDVEARMEAALKRALATKPTPHKPVDKKDGRESPPDRPRS